jgi:hypothetical protein
MIKYIILISGIIGFSSGYYFSELKNDSVKVAELEAKNKRILELSKKYSELEIKLSKAKDKQNIIYKTVYKQLPNTLNNDQKNDSNCNISNDTKRLLDDLILSETTASLDDSYSRSSEIRESDLIKYLIEVINYYKKAQLQCNTLMELYK